MHKKTSGLTPAQRSAFFRALQAASIELGYDTPEEREAYRKTVMREETGKEHLAQLSRRVRDGSCRSSRSTAQASRKTCWRIASSGMNGARSPTPSSGRTVFLPSFHIRPRLLITRAYGG